MTLSDDRLRQIRQACANGLNPELPGVEVDEMAAELLMLRREKRTHEDALEDAYQRGVDDTEINYRD